MRAIGTGAKRKAVKAFGSRQWPALLWAPGSQWARRGALALLLAAAAAAYCYRLGSAPLAASEAYSALAAAQPTVAQVARSTLRYDPGKPILYQLLLHWFCRWAGHSEAGVRALSVLCAVASLYLVFALGREWFGDEAGMAAALLWGLNPLAVVLARWARMYSLLVAVALGHLLAMAKRRRGAGGGTLAAAALLGAAMLYVHLGALLILGADVIVMVREVRRSGNSSTWPAIALAGLLFVPFLPIGIGQLRALLFGHWMDWLGVGKGSPLQMALAASGAGAALLWLAMGSGGDDARRERLQQGLIYALVPMLVLGTGSVLIRPMFEVRYVSPSCAVMAVVAAGLLERAGARLRNLSAVGVGAFWAALLPLCYAIPHDPWPAIAARIAADAHPGEPIFFEAGFFSPDDISAGAADGAFAQGFFRVPFDYYFHLDNPRAAVPAGCPALARKLIEARLAGGGGAWLVSARKWSDAVAELPQGPHLRVDFVARFARILVLHVRVTRPLNPPARAPDPAPP